VQNLALQVPGHAVSNGVCQMCEFIIRRRLNMVKPQLVRTVEVNTVLSRLCLLTFEFFLGSMIR
jgi:hypothetical protein